MTPTRRNSRCAHPPRRCGLLHGDVPCVVVSAHACAQLGAGFLDRVVKRFALPPSATLQVSQSRLVPGAHGAQFNDALGRTVPASDLSDSMQVRVVRNG